MWFPAAHHVFIIGVSERSYALWQPVLDVALFKKLEKDDVADFKEVNRAFVSSNLTSVPWKSIGNAFLAFCDTL